MEPVISTSTAQLANANTANSLLDRNVPGSSASSTYPGSDRKINPKPEDKEEAAASDVLQTETTFL